jgi:error-prone DNA polymerase
MICDADTIGVFQIESRAQMTMLPRLKPRTFYDLVIEVAIVRPGPIQGGMIHPYLRRRNGTEPITYPDERIKSVLEKTLGVPLFQEQVMKIAMVAAGFTPGEADQLRRAMAAWKRGGHLERFQHKLLEGMQANGYSSAFAEVLFKQISGFAEYGFPESHAASFALLVYVSAWLKRHHPAAFLAGMINSQPLGFYSPGQLVRDAQAHGVTVLPVDINASGYDCRLESAPANQQQHDQPQRARQRNTTPQYGAGGPVVRLGMRLVRGLSASKVRAIERLQAHGRIRSLSALLREPDLTRDTLLRLAAADAFRSLGLSRREALWQIFALDHRKQTTLFSELEDATPPPALPNMPVDEVVAADYDAVGLSLNAHPFELIRPLLSRLRVIPNARLDVARDRQRVRVAGLVTVRQRPSTAKGIVFITLEDETGMANLIVRPHIWESEGRRTRNKIAVIAEGHIEREGSVIHVQVQRLRDVSAELGALNHRSRDFH